MKRPRLSLRTQAGETDRMLLLVVLLLVIFGVAMVFDASVADATRTFNDKFFFLKRQLLWVILGLGGMGVASCVHYKFWEKMSVPFLGATVILLVLVLIPGIGVSALGASRRIGLFGFLGIQPAEFAKLSLSIFLAASLSKDNSLSRFILPVGIVCFLIIIEPDMGTTAIVGAMAFVIYFASGARFVHMAMIAAGGTFGAFLLAMLSPYRRDRIITYFNHHTDILSSTDGTYYHMRQILIALGTGGLWGLGIGQSRQKYLYLPEPATDSIFAIITEELGFVGALSLILAFLFLIFRGFSIASKIEEPFGRLLAVGITSWIALQTLINLSAMVSLIPLTGIPLPLVSYGGSSLLVTLVGIGILLNISRYGSVKK